MRDVVARATTHERAERAADALVVHIAHGGRHVLVREADLLRDDEWVPQAIDGERYLIADSAVDCAEVR